VFFACGLHRPSRRRRRRRSSSPPHDRRAGGGLVETVPVALDDNVSVPATAGAVLWLGSLVTPGAWTAHADAVAANLAAAVAVNTVAATGGWLLRTVRLSGMLVGWAIGVVVYASLGLQGWSLLF